MKIGILFFYKIVGIMCRIMNYLIRNLNLIFVRLLLYFDKDVLVWFLLLW